MINSCELPIFSEALPVQFCTWKSFSKKAPRSQTSMWRSLIASFTFLSFWLVNHTLLNYNSSKTLNLYGHSKHILCNMAMMTTRIGWVSLKGRSSRDGHGKWYFFTKSVFQSYQEARCHTFTRWKLCYHPWNCQHSHLKKDGWNIIAFHFGGQGASGANLLLVFGSAKLQNNWIMFQSQMFILFVSSRFFEYGFYRFI